MDEGNAARKIPDKHFNRLLVEYDTEQSALEQEAAGLKEAITAQAGGYFDSRGTGNGSKFGFCFGREV